jgi:uncharacterized GH25 family protein
LLNNQYFKDMKKILLTFLMAFSASIAFAHSLWIETSSTGKSGQLQNVKLFYGEYGQNEKDEFSKWHSDLPELTLWLTAPDGKKEKLVLAKGTNFLEASFTPQKDGAYTLAVSHKSKDLSGTYQLEFLASATVAVGKPAVLANAAANNNELKILPVGDTKVNKPVSLKVWLNGASKAGLTVLLFSPVKWGQELVTDADGSVTFTPLWPGKYMVEATASTPGEGEHNGNKYTVLWQGATYTFEVAK